MQNDIAASNIKKGDLSYVELNERFFFMQVIHISINFSFFPIQRFRSNLIRH